MTDPLSELMEELSEFVTQEAEATRRAFHTQWNLPLADRVESGRCIDALKFSALKDGRLRLTCAEENSSDFREGDLVRLSRDNPMAPKVTGSVYRIEDHEIWIEPDKSPPIEELSSGKWAMDPSFIDLESFYRGTLKDLAETERGRQLILPLIAGKKEPRIDLERFEEASEKAEREGVNEAQSEAIAQSVATDLCHLVQGPPGTGKTFMLAHVVKQRVAHGEKILVTAATHRAIHNALNMVRKVAPEITDIIKIGRKIYDPELQVAQYESFSESPLQQCEGGYVVGATPFALRGNRLRRVEFDAVVIDEAGQVTLPLALMAMLSADTYLLMGDHRQLAPVVQTLALSEAHLASIFGRLVGRGYDTMLDVTYRMNAELAHWPAESFYSGKLHSAKQNAGRRLALPQAPSDFLEILDPAAPLVFVEMAHRGSRRSSNDEATLAADLLVNLKRSGFSFADVAVVVPFRRQARRIRMFLNAKKAILPQDLSACVIDTVDRMQGQEREVVILSMTASEPEYVIQLLEFILQPQRLNVAVTRARSKVIILASEQLAMADPIDPVGIELVALWKSLRDSSRVVRI